MVIADLHEPSRFCGRGEGLVDDGENKATICCESEEVQHQCQLPIPSAADHVPFVLRFNSDAFEFTGTNDDGNAREAAANDIGFRLAFFQDNKLCFDPTA